MTQQRDDIVDHLAGHWETPAGAEIAAEYAGQTREHLAMPHLTDMVLANAVYMASRHDLNLIAYQTAAKERIRWLSVQLALARAALSEAEQRGARAMQTAALKALKTAQYDPAPYTEGKYAIQSIDPTKLEVPGHG